MRVNGLGVLEGAQRVLCVAVSSQVRRRTRGVVLGGRSARQRGWRRRALGGSCLEQERAAWPRSTSVKTEPLTGREGGADLSVTAAAVLETD